MFGAALSLLSELAESSPVLLVIEDLHWADATTRHLLTFLARMLHRERVAIIGTYRTDDLHRRHPLRSVIAELLRLPMVALVELGPLSAAALAEILSDGRNAPMPMSAATLNSLVERAEGNAYYAEELLNASSCAEDGTGGTLPTGLAELLLSRVERVSDAAQQVLRAAAVAGGGADDLVRAASGLPDDAYELAVREAAGQQLLAPDGPDGYRFRHALLREAVYGDLMPGERTRLHARLAEPPRGRTRRRRRARAPQLGEPRRPRCVRRLGPGRQRGRAPRGARRSAPPLRHGPGTVGAGGSGGADRGDDARQARPEVRAGRRREW